MKKIRTRNRPPHPMTTFAIALLALLLASAPTVITAASSCGGGNVGDGSCTDPTHCCSKWGYCGPGESYCGAEKPTPPVAAPTTADAPPPSPPTGDHDGGAMGDNRLVAYLGNWQQCPDESRVAAYTHIVIAFAVSYTWSPGKNICSPTCEIATPPVCANAPHQNLIDTWRALGKKVILSFGGAGMGGSWSGDVNDCWEYCFGREEEVVTRLTEIVNEMNLDGVDIDYEYFYEDGQNGSDFASGTKAQRFLMDVTTGLRDTLPAGSEITHAPMDSDVQPGKAYYDILVSLGTGGYLDYLMPQYYNGVTRPVMEFTKALSHYRTITDAAFDGDATKMVFGFCVSDCMGTGSNASGEQAAAVLTKLGAVYDCHGGAFFWVSENDVGGLWSQEVAAAMTNRGCSETTTMPVTMGVPTSLPTLAPTIGAVLGVPTSSPTLAPTIGAVVTDEPTTVPEMPLPTSAPLKMFTDTPVFVTMAPVAPPVSSPVAPPTPSDCVASCEVGYTGLNPYDGCKSFYHCVNGAVSGNILSCSPGTLFDIEYSNCNWADLTECSVPSCDKEDDNDAPVPSPTTKALVVTPVTDAPTDEEDCSLTCPPGYTGYKAYNECLQYYYCDNGVLIGDLHKAPEGTLYDEPQQNFDWEDNVTCDLGVCDETPTSSPVGDETPTSSPVASPTTNDQRCCQTAYTGLKATDNCRKYFHCVNGVVTGPDMDCPSGTLFDYNHQNCNWKKDVTCVDDAESCS